MAVSTEKQCVKTSCSLRGMRVITDLGACLGCGEALRATTISDLADLLDPFTTDGRRPVGWPSR